jgi:outer membrane usher protein
MTTVKRGHCLWTAPAVSLAAALVCSSSAWAEPAQATAQDQAAEDEELHLEVLLNRVPTRLIARFVLRQGQLLAEANTLHSLGLTWPGAEATDTADSLVALASLPGLRSDYDVADQRLHLFAPIELLDRPVTTLGHETPAFSRLDPTTRVPGLLLNYDVFAQGDPHSHSISGWNELRLFGLGAGLLRSSSLLQQSGGDYHAEQMRYIRLDSSWQLDFPETMVSLTLGDAYSGALSWTRSSRFGGLHVSRNFGLQPYRVTVPLAAFAGEAVLPSVVDLYINGLRQTQSTVAPGRFEVIGAPVLNGSGNAQMVITDITGQSRVLNFPLYNSARLLQQGLSDWSADLGSLRRHYGLRSLSYAEQPMLSGSARYGLSNQLTLEAHGEASDGLAMGGIGSQLLLGTAGGVVSAALASSHHAGQDTGQHTNQRGRQHSLGYEWQNARLSLNLSTLRRNQDFRDVASLEGAALPRRTETAFIGLHLGRGQLGASYVRQDLPNSPRASYAGLSWSQSLDRYGNLSLGLSRDLDGDRGSSAYLYWSLPLGNRHHAWASAEHQRQGNTSTAGAMRALPGDRDGWGWRVQASAGEVAGAQAEISQLSRYGQWRVGTQYWRNQGDSNSASYANASGGLLLMQGSVFPMRRVFDAFALVSTDGIKDVPVLLENRPVGSTDDKGLLLVTPLNAWENNDLSIDPLVLPADVSVQRVRLSAVPATGSGVLARFPMRALLVVELALRGADGAWIAAGTSVTLEPGGQQATVGYDGRLYLQDPPAGGRLTAQLAQGPCVARLPEAFPLRGRIDLGDLLCR